jgi:hypothetical protein
LATSYLEILSHDTVRRTRTRLRRVFSQAAVERAGAEYPAPMDDPITVAVEVPQVGDERRKNWAKVVSNVDGSLATGWAYEGEFIATGGVQDVPIGSVVLVYGEKGSRANPAIEARVYTVNADATLSQRAGAKGRAWARTLRDPIEALLAEAGAEPIDRLDWSPELMRYATEALREELDRRDG